MRYLSFFPILALLWFTPALAGQHDSPDPNLTPGAVFEDATVEEICTPGYARSVRYVPPEVRRQVYAAYGLRGNHTGYCSGKEGCEVDHLISLELGGSNDASNLWPESFDAKPWNAHVKDKIEDRLHALVCDGEIDLKEAQHAIATDWIAALRKYGDEAMIPASSDSQSTTTTEQDDQSDQQTGTSQHFASEDDAKSNCPSGVEWVNARSGARHLPGDEYYGHTKSGYYECVRE